MNTTWVCGFIFSLAAGFAVTANAVAAEYDAAQNSVRAYDEAAADANASRNLDFYASDKAVQLRYERDSSVVSVDSGRVTVGFLFDEERDNIFSGGLVMDSTPEFLPGVTFSFGGKVYAALLGQENSDVFGIGMGIEASYDLPVEQFPLRMEAALYYSPDVLSFGQADRIIDWQVNVGLRLRDSIFGYTGFRFLEFDTRPGNHRPDNAVHVGIRWDMKP